MMNGDKSTTNHGLQLIIAVGEMVLFLNNGSVGILYETFLFPSLEICITLMAQTALLSTYLSHGQFAIGATV